MILGQKIKKLRIVLGLTRPELGLLLNISECKMYNIETKTNNNININIIKELHENFNVPYEYFFDDDDNDEKILNDLKNDFISFQEDFLVYQRDEKHGRKKNNKN